MTQDANCYEVIDKGWTSIVYRLKDAQKIVKVVDDPSDHGYYTRERSVYERLTQANTGHTSILKFFGESEIFKDGLILEYAEKGSMYKYLWDCHNIFPENKPDRHMLRKWALQASDGLAFVHDCGVLHCDIHIANFFLDHNLDVKIGDFGASSIDGSRPLLMYRTSHQLWSQKDDKWQREVSYLSEIFALGSAFYNMETGHDPFEEIYNDENKAEMIDRLRNKSMPPIDKLSALGTIIRNCWQGQYKLMAAISAELRLNLYNSASE